MVWGTDGKVRMILSKVTVSCQDWKESSIFICGGVFADYVNSYDKVFLAEAVNVFQPFTIYEKGPAMAVRHNPKYISDILLTIFTAVHAFFL